MPPRRLWFLLFAVVGVAFAILGFFGREVYRQAPPIPDRVVDEAGKVLMTRDDILDGQEVWQSIGGQEVGSIWGHGAYQAPDWSADWLHREAVALLGLEAREAGAGSLDALTPDAQAAVRARVRDTLRTNSWDPATGDLVLSAERAAAVAEVAAWYDGLFGGDPSFDALREDYALSALPVPDPARRERLADFFFWTAWASAAERPGTGASYTNNWPHEPLAGNAPTPANVLWSVASIVLLLAGVGAMIWFQAVRGREEDPPAPPATDPLDRLVLTPSMRAVWPYAATVAALLVVQVLLGALLAHYTIEGQGFYGIPLAEVLPYAVVRTWHVQSGIFWIATAFLAAGLFLAPAIGGREPPGQRTGVLVLWGALLLVVAGSFTGQWLRIQGHLGDGVGWWFGHQGYEYVDLGRAWQIALYGGLLLWLFLVIRGIRPALTRAEAQRPLLALFAGSVVAIGLLYGAGLFFGPRTHLSVMEYWRWWVVHLWVEGFFEVFATAATAFLFHRMGLVTAGSATRATVLTTALYLGAGIPGTFHHLYFSGTPVSILAIGATFSALEVVPLVLVGYEAAQNLRYARAAPWMDRYRWPLRFFLGVAFWNFVGAGIFGFLINPPIALYYVQGLNTTPVHAHTALFGVYGLLALGLVLLVLTRLTPGAGWPDRTLKAAFWGMNVGLAMMVLLSILPVGLVQAHASIATGLWYARSADLLQSPLVSGLRWARLPGDTVFLVGAFAFAWAVARILGRRARA